VSNDEMNKEEEKYFLDRVWYKPAEVKNDWASVSKSPYIFLTNAPLTFGHSQLVIPIDYMTNSVNESTFFSTASPIITITLKVFNDVFGKKKIHFKAAFQKLAMDTYSYGKYLKTLVLRTSASEKPDREFKVHLVPYFQSNQVECHKRFHSHHKAPPHKHGGMIGWLGERETQVDKWLVDGFPGSLSLDQIGRDVWKLPALAKQLKRVWTRQQGTEGDAVNRGTN